MMTHTIHRAPRGPRLALCAALGGGLLLAGCAEEVGFYAQPRGVLGVALASNVQVQDLNGPGLTFEEERIVEGLAAAFADAVDAEILFAFDSAALDAAARATLDAQAAWLLENPRAAVRVYGHTDLAGSEPYNDALGLRRARAAARRLQAAGVAPNRIQSVASLGESEPVVLTPAPEQRNRRSLTAVVGLADAGGGPMRVSRLFSGERAQRAMRRYRADKVEKPVAAGTTNVGLDALGQ